MKDRREPTPIPAKEKEAEKQLTITFPAKIWEKVLRGMVPSLRMIADREINDYRNISPEAKEEDESVRKAAVVIAKGLGLDKQTTSFDPLFTMHLLNAGLPELVPPDHLAKMEQWSARRNGLDPKLFYFLEKGK